MSDDLVHDTDDALLEEAFEAFPELQAPPDLMDRLLRLTQQTLAGEAVPAPAPDMRACAAPDVDACAAPDVDACAAPDVDACAEATTAEPSRDHPAHLAVASTHHPADLTVSRTGLPAGLAEILRTLVTESGGHRFLLKTAALSVTVGLSFGATFGTCARAPEAQGPPSTAEDHALPGWKTH